MRTPATRRLFLSTQLIRSGNASTPSASLNLCRIYSSPKPKFMSSLSASAPPPAPPAEPTFNFELSKIPKNPLGEGRCIRTAAALIIGDEILNGKTLDRNSNYFARYCFEHGIELKRVEVIADDEAQIIEASRRMVQNYDFVVTSGGIGPTHDDITYRSLARAFTLGKLAYHQETLRRMEETSRHRRWTKEQTPEQKLAREQMAWFPHTGRDRVVDGDGVEVLFVREDIWVPVVRLAGKLCIFPGIPSLFQKMLDSLTLFLPLPPREERPTRLQVFTSLPESSIAPYLSALQQRVQPEGIRIGSYPVIQKGVYVSLIGSNKERVKELGGEVEKETHGREVSEEEALEKRRRQSGSYGI